MDTCDGFLLTGGRPNVHPEEYGEEETPAHGDFDRARDAITLPLVRACVERGQPFLGVCRGFQEVNVAMGGTLYPEIRDLPGRMNHRMPPDGTLDEKFALRHVVRFTEGGVFHRLMGAPEVMTNTLHGQGVKRAGGRIVIDGHAPDGTPEALVRRGSARLHPVGAMAPRMARGRRPRVAPLVRGVRRRRPRLGQRRAGMEVERMKLKLGILGLATLVGAGFGP